MLRRPSKASQVSKLPTRLHSFLLASYPVLGLFAANAGQIEVSAALRPLLLSLVLAALLLVVFRLITGSPQKGAVFASLSLIAFFAYGHLYAALKQLGPLFVAVIRHRFLLPLVLILLGLTMWRARRAASQRWMHSLLNIVGVLLIAQPVIAYALFAVESAGLVRSIAERPPGCTLPRADIDQLPDVYIIIMDAYERDDVLLEMHGYDNTPFIRSLERLGFYVARGSLSNYRHTEMSVPSLLNMDYIQNIPNAVVEGSDNVSGLVELIKHSRLRRELECLGYSSVAIETGVVWTEWRDADYFISRQAGVLHRLQFLGGLTRFESLLIRTTMLRAALDLSTRLQAPEQALSDDPIEVHRERVLYEFEQLSQVPALPGPKLVFAHILSPHPPFVFGPKGEAVSEAEFETDLGGETQLLAAYADQVHFLNGKLLAAVEAIEAGSSVPPVIIIQGDHGWADRDAEDKHSILNAYHFPDGDYAALYPTITPVNSLRVVLNQYFGGSFDLLDDISYFSTEDDIFHFEIVTNSWLPSETER